MVIDRLENLEKYVSLNPMFAQVAEYLKSANLSAQDKDKVVLKEGELIVNFSHVPPQTKEEAKIETHNDFIDIQIPLSGVEVMGYMPRADLPEGVYDAEKDVTFHDGPTTDYLTVKPGMFVIFFPEDAHAPGVSAGGVDKVIVKIRVK